MKLCSMLCGNLDAGEFGDEWIHVYAWLSPFAIHLKLSHIVIYPNRKYKAEKKIKQYRNSNLHSASKAVLSDYLLD